MYMDKELESGFEDKFIGLFGWTFRIGDCRCMVGYNDCFVY